MVTAIDQHDPDGSPSQRLGGSKPSEPPADDDDNRYSPSHSEATEQSHCQFHGGLPSGGVDAGVRVSRRPVFLQTHRRR